MDPTNIGQVRRGVLIESYEANAEAVAWSGAHASAIFLYPSFFLFKLE